VHAVNSVPIEISIVLGRAEMPIRQLLKMGRGAVIDLDAGHDTPVRVYANKKLIAFGDVVISGDRVAVTITESVRDHQE